MELSDKINQLNHSKKAQAWVFTIINYVLSYLVLTGNNPLGEDTYAPIGYLFILTAIYLTYLHIKAWMTGKDVWERVNFGLIGGEEELKESNTTKQVKSVLKKILVMGIILTLVAIVVCIAIVSIMDVQNLE